MQDFGFIQQFHQLKQQINCQMGQKQSTIHFYLQSIAKLQTITEQSYLFDQFNAFKQNSERLDRENREFTLLNHLGNKIVLKFAKQVDKIEDYEGEISVISKRNIGQKLFEGTLKKGVKQGYGKQYDSAGKFIYQGNYHNDLFEGLGKTANYQGQFKRGKKEGWGIWQDKERGLRYEGCFIKDKFQGLGYLNVKSSDLQNFLQQNLFITDSSVLVKYVGEWKEGKFHGQGKLLTSNELYTGSFIDGYFQGQGKLVSVNGKQQGKFLKGQKIHQ